MRVIDSHCHLEAKDFGDEREAVIARGRAAGLCHFVVVGAGADLASVDNAVALAEKNPDMSAAIGIHPHDVARMPAEALPTIERLARQHPRVCAVGETGLDYHYDHSPRPAQKQAFRDFIGIARRAGKALTLHIRSNNDPARGDAHGEALAILDEERGFEVPVVVHCFTGSVEEARRWLSRGAYLSFSGIATFKSAAVLREAAALAPPDRVLVETDCPYLAPLPYRGKRNEPAYVVETLKVIAQARRLPLEEAGELTTANTVAAFGLQPPRRSAR